MFIKDIHKGAPSDHKHTERASIYTESGANDPASDADSPAASRRHDLPESPDMTGVQGRFVDIDGERYYLIEHADKMAPFFISIVSDADHWLFVSSTGGLTAGRVSPATALFPYVTVDKIHDNAVHTGCKTILQLGIDGKHYEWEPFNMEHDGLYQITRNIYKNTLGNKLRFEEINHDLQLLYRYTWETSDKYGFVRRCELTNLSEDVVEVDIVDGLQNILPAGTPRFLQERSSNLVDAYKWSELDPLTGLALFTLFSGISDRAEPCESLRANTVFCLGLDDSNVLISSDQLEDFRLGHELSQENHKRGIRGAYLVNKKIRLESGSAQHWSFVADIEQSQSEVLSLSKRLSAPDDLAGDIKASVDAGSERLSRIMAGSDGFQMVNEENVAAHHYANVLFNVLRGGIFDDQYRISTADFLTNIRHFNQAVYRRHQQLLSGLPDKINFAELLTRVREQGDAHLERLCLEYLPITFGRRHGDPSRPWNVFEIRTRDKQGRPVLFYEGNWRDIFQNWEALLWSYPEFIENVIAKFVNASTMDGYNPYRITKLGIDWEVEDPEDPWSYIGYWGDHQIIYLLKLLEQSSDFHPARLGGLLRKQVYSYANVPYRIKPFESLLRDAKSTVSFDEALELEIEKRIDSIGADGRLVLGSEGEVYLVNLLEKLLVPLLSKLGNLVVGGGIWLNTQRPEWNDANNALVGQGLSMVTLYYLRRYVSFMRSLLSAETEHFTLSSEVSDWLAETSAAMSAISSNIENNHFSSADRYETLARLGQAADNYRQRVYQQGGFSGCVDQSIASVLDLLDDAIIVIDDSIAKNLRQDGLYHAYNLISIDGETVDVEYLYPMLEGQVAVLSSGAISPEQAVSVLEALFDSEMFRSDIHTFMLYPDRALPSFMEKNIVPAEATAIPLISSMLQAGDHRLVVRDEDGNLRFDASLVNKGAVEDVLLQIAEDYSGQVDADSASIFKLYEEVFNHKAFTGRSGGMFGFEGLGCVYWHMVSKLLLAVQEVFFHALDQGRDEMTLSRLGRLYYRVRAGLGFNKTPREYGAFPTDPYSHTPGHAGAQQPGMTGQVKEEIIARFGEFGARVRNGTVTFQPDLLRRCEFLEQALEHRYLDVSGEWRTIHVPQDALCYTWCQVPVIYRLGAQGQTTMSIELHDGAKVDVDGADMPAEYCAELFGRTGRIDSISVFLDSGILLDE